MRSATKYNPTVALAARVGIVRVSFGKEQQLSAGVPGIGTRHPQCRLSSRSRGVGVGFGLEQQCQHVDVAVLRGDEPARVRGQNTGANNRRFA
jgi:hypothetical protein